MSENEVLKKIKEYARLKRKTAELSEQMDGIADEIKAYMGDSEELNLAGYKVSYANVESSRFDTTAFKREHFNLYNQFINKITTRRFAVKA